MGVIRVGMIMSDTCLNECQFWTLNQDELADIGS
jgi:hypothetical protein